MLLQEKQKRLTERKILTYYPDEGPLRRELYPKHQAFFTAGAAKRQRLMLAANRVGKTEGVGCYEATLHATGQYPDWWTGRRFNKAVTIWVAGDTGHTVREILQAKLLGPILTPGTGLIPGASLSKVIRKSGVPDAVDTVYVKHASGGTSKIVFKAYEQGVEAFQGTEIDVILLDEEPPMDIYTECLMRTMTNNGIIMCTFTPLLGMSEVVLYFLPGGKLAEDNTDAAKFVIMATWDDVPHLTEEAKKELWASIPPFQRDSRSKGIPQLGAGAIFPVPEADISVDDFSIPDSWPRSFGLDVGWNRTAGVWTARDKQTGVDYLYSEYYRGQAEPVIHVNAFKARGLWVPGVIDPASRGRSQHDGTQLLQAYRLLGLNLELAKNAREAGLLEVWQRLSTGKLKIFKSCTNWFAEYRLYRRDEKGEVVKENDHLMDATRYDIMSGLQRARTAPPKVEKQERLEYRPYGNDYQSGWMQ